MLQTLSNDVKEYERNSKQRSWHEGPVSLGRIAHLSSNLRKISKQTKKKKKKQNDLIMTRMLLIYLSTYVHYIHTLNVLKMHSFSWLILRTARRWSNVSSRLPVVTRLLHCALINMLYVLWHMTFLQINNEVATTILFILETGSPRHKKKAKNHAQGQTDRWCLEAS